MKIDISMISYLISLTVCSIAWAILFGRKCNRKMFLSDYQLTRREFEVFILTWIVCIVSLSTMLISIGLICEAIGIIIGAEVLLFVEIK